MLALTDRYAKNVVMDGPEMAALLQRIGWTGGELARRLNTRDITVSRWLNGRREIPDNLAEWLQQVADQLDKAPPLPRDWRNQ